jgi:glucose/arabinose dehydrogenase
MRWIEINPITGENFEYNSQISRGHCMKHVIGLLAGVAILTSFARADFIDEVYVSGQSFITTVAFSPDGKMYFIEKNTGRVKVVMGQNLVRPEPFFQFQVNNLGERGGLGLTFHPQYPDSPYVYCYVTIPLPVLANVVVRLIDSAGFGTNPDTIFRAPITVTATNHNGGNLRFGPDGKLYITIGENAQPSWAQDTCRVQGKIIRINYDGTIPDDNPISCAPIYAYGLRNSYDFCFHPQTGALYASENGPNANDEVNLILPGRNYGWPTVQCSSSNPAYEDALICWTPTNAPTGIVVAWNSLIPEFNGKLLMTDWNFGVLHLMTLNQDGDSILADEHVYDSGSGLVDVEQGPEGFFYLTSGTGSIIRLRPQTNAPSPFPLRLPYPGENVVNYITQFTWGASHDTEGPVTYRFQIGTDTSFVTPSYDVFVNDTTQSAVTDSLYARGRTLYWRVLAIDSDSNITQGGIPLPEKRQLHVLDAGDANTSGSLNGLDVLYLVSYLKGIGNPPEPILAANAEGDCVVNGLDVVYLINYFKGGLPPIRGNCADRSDPIRH